MASGIPALSNEGKKSIRILWVLQNYEKKHCWFGQYVYLLLKYWFLIIFDENEKNLFQSCAEAKFDKETGEVLKI